MVDRADVECVLPLTPTQQGILLHSIDGSERGTYLNQVVVTLAGRLDPALLRACWDATVRRHDSLRAAFVWKSLDQPLQALHREADVKWTELDWRDRPAEDRDRELSRYLAQDAARPFRLGRAPLMRLMLARRAADQWWLVWTYHHLLVDGWSMSLVLQEVFARYHAGGDGVRPELTGPAPSYRDYVGWLYAQDDTEAERFWRRHLADFDGPTPLPCVRPIPAGDQGSGDVPVDLPERDTAALQRFCRRHGVTPGVAVQGAWALLLSRYSGRSTVTFGSVSAGRPPELPGFDAMVGMFSTTLPIVLAVDPGAAPGPWLRAVQAALADIRQYEHSALTRIARWAGVAGAANLFGSIVAVENQAPLSALAGTGDGLRVVDAVTQDRPHFAIAVAANVGDRIRLRLHVDWRWYDRAAAELVARQLACLLGALATGDQRSLGELSMLSAPERATVLGRWAGAGWGEPLGATVSEAFEAQVARTPEAPAVDSPQETLSYRDLAMRVNQLDSRLRELGVAPEVPVAVCLHKSTELLVALLAVIRAGGILVPVEPGQPPARLASLLASSDSQLLLAGPGVTVDAGDAVRVLRWGAVADRDGGPGEPATDAHRPVRLRPDHAVHILYPSGATGEPKGVIATHRGLLGHLGWLQRTFPIGPGDRVPLTTSIGFEIAAWETYWPLLTGACVVVLETATSDVVAQAVEMAGRGITFTSYLPSALDGVLADPARPLPASLRQLFLAGEALAVDTVVALRQVCAARVVSLCGPTEAAAASTAWEVPAAGRPERVPAGRPSDNASCYLLDGELEPVAVGEPGEWYLAGDALGRGYASRPGWTADRFVPNPFGPPGGRSYRTGESARWLPGGDIEWLGRVDRQVQIRGHRVEPGEVTANGKVDRAALPDPPPARPAPTGRPAAPTTEAERVLATIWAQTLGVGQVGVQDNFFELGGDSILGLLIVSRAAQAGLTITPGQLLDCQTMADLAQVARWSAGVAAGPEPAQDVAPVALTPPQHWFFAQELPHPEQWNLGLWFSIPASGDPLLADPDRLAELLEPVFAAIVAHHDALRIRFARNPVAGWVAERVPATSPVVDRAFSVVTVADRPDWQDALGEVADRAQAIPLGEPPLLRAVLVNGGRPDRLRLLLIAHHLVVDGVSWRVLLDDLQLGFGQAAAGQPVRLPAPGTSYGAWASALAGLATRPDIRADLPFWQAQLAAGADGSGPGTAEPPGVATEAEVRHVSVTLSRDETRSLVQEVPARYRSQVEDALLAAFGASLAGLTGRTELVLALETHGREQHLVPGAGLTRTVGWFTAIAPVRLRLPAPDADPGESLVMVKECLRQVPHRGLSYGVLRYLARSGPEAVLATHPEPAVAFHHLGQFGLASGAPGAAARLPLEPAPDLDPALRHPANPRPFPLEVVSAISNRGLRLSFSYHPDHHPEPTIRALAEGTVVQLRRLIAHCRRQTRTVLTPSDFPESGLDQQQLDRLVAEVDRTE